MLCLEDVKVECLAEEVFRRKAAGETDREIGERFGLSREQVKQLATRQRRKQRLIEQGYVSPPKGRSRKVLAFIDSIKHLRAQEGCTILPIRVTNKDNLAILGSSVGVSRGVSYIMEMGLISLENDQYQFNVYYGEDNTSKTYRYYKENEDKALYDCTLITVSFLV